MINKKSIQSGLIKFYWNIWLTWLILVSLAACNAPAAPQRAISDAEIKDQQPVTTVALIATDIPIPTPTPIPSRTNKPAPTITLKPSITQLLTNTPTSTLAASPTLLTWECLVNKEQTQALVTRVLDGDTIEVKIDGVTYKVRYTGINAPADTDPSGIGKQATEQNKALVEGQTVTLVRDTSDKDKYGRLLRYILLGDVMGGRFVNYELVKAGLAQAAPYPPDTACQDTFLVAQDQARLELAGVWKSNAETATAFQANLPVAAAATTPAGGNEKSGKPEACTCTGPDLDCKDFPSRASAQSCFNYCIAQGYGDVYNLDGDGDHLVCETMP